jgi:hypothetical protein
LTLGRAPTNDVCIQDDRISWHHAMVWFEGGTLWIKDLGSRNGTHVDEQRISTPTQISSTSKVRLGPELHLELSVVGEQALDMPLAFAIETADGSLRYSIQTDRFVIGSSPDADLRLDDGPEEAAMLLLVGMGQVWLGMDDEDHPLEADEPFQVAGRTFVLRVADQVHAPTAAPEGERYNYRLEATLDGSTGPEATLLDLNLGLRYIVSAENRAVLLYLLATQVAKDRAAGMGTSECGWIQDQTVATGIWGRGSKGKDTNSLHVLVYRLRRELKGAGFDPWFIEKRKRYIRARLAEVQIT